MYENDNPEWVAKLVRDLDGTKMDGCIPTDNEIWEIAKQDDNPPHLANIWMAVLFERIEAFAEEKYCGDVKVEYEVNAMASSLNVNRNSVTTAKELLDIFKGKENGVVIFEDDEPEDGIKIQVDVGNDVVILLVDTGDKYEWVTQDEYAFKPREKIDVDIDEWSQEFLEYYDFSIYKNQYIAEHLADIEAIMKVNKDKSIRYLMVGAIVDTLFFGSICDYTGGGEHTEYRFEENEMIEGDYPDNIFEETYPTLYDRIEKFKIDKGIDLDGIGNYVYIGEEDTNGLKVIGETIKPIEVGNTIFEENYEKD